MPIRQLPIQYTHPDGVDVNGGGGNSPQNDYVKSSDLANVAFTGDYNDLSNKPSDGSGIGNSMFEPINVSMLVNNGSLIFALNYPISEGSYFIIKIPTEINTSIPNGIILRYNNTNYFNGTNIRVFNRSGIQIENVTMDYIKNYIGYPGMLICRLQDGLLYIRRFSLSEFASGFSSDDFLKQKDIANLEVTPKTAKIGELYYEGAWKYSLQSELSYNEFCIVTISGTEHALENTDTLSYNQYPTFTYGHYVRLYKNNNYSPLLLSARNLNAKYFLLQKISLSNAPFYKLFDLNYFSNLFGFCYLSTLNDSSQLYIVMPYNKSIQNTSATFILETYLDSDVRSAIDTCKVISKDGLYSNCQITLNGYKISYNTPLKKDCTYICTITSSGSVTLTRH